MPVRIASVPSDHVYVRHLAPPEQDSGPGREVVRLADPPVPGAPAGQWWPSPVLEPSWLRARADSYDVVHVHFGFEHRTAPQLTELVDVLRALGKPLVLTVHDLDNPHLADQLPHRRGLDVLVPAAAAVITLTPGAAAEIAARWGRAARVLPHPHVVGLDRLGRPRPPRDGFVVGLHAKRRANTDPEAVRPVLRSAVAALPGGRLQPDPTRRLSDDELWDHLAALDVLVLPYLFGSHSGFVEACHDLGTAVVAPDVGYLAEQQPVVSYDPSEAGSLAAALCTAYEQRPAPRAAPAARRRQQSELADAHAELYVQVLGAAA